MKNAIGLLLMVALSAVDADYNLGVGIADVTGPIAGITLVNLFPIFSHLVPTYLPAATEEVGTYLSSSVKSVKFDSFDPTVY